MPGCRGFVDVGGAKPHLVGVTEDMPAADFVEKIRKLIAEKSASLD